MDIESALLRLFELEDTGGRVPCFGVIHSSLKLRRISELDCHNGRFFACFGGIF